MPDPTSPANDVEAALAAWEAARHRSETQAPYSAAATLRVAGHALAELVARIPTLEAALATYGGHLSSCLSIRAGRDCDCGWDSTACGRVRGVGHMETMADPYRRGRTEVLVSAPPEPSPPMEIRAPEALRPPALTEIQKWEIVAEALRNGTVDSREKTLALRAEVSSLTADLAEATRILHDCNEWVHDWKAPGLYAFIAKHPLPTEEVSGE